MHRIKLFLLIIILSLLFMPVIDIILVRWKTPSIIENLLQAEGCVLEIGKIEKEKIHVLIQVEDPTFYENNGWDFDSPGAGFTTISQAVGKQIYFNRFQPGIRKIRLLYLSRFALSPVVSKNDIITVFMNYAYLGNNNGLEIYGFEKASKSYFKKPFDSLTNNEYLSLIAMLISPNEFHVIRHSDKNMERVRRIKNLLQGKGKPLNWKDVELEGCK